MTTSPLLKGLCAKLREPEASWRLALGLLAAGALLLRLWQIGYHSLWFDETISVFWARQPAREILDVGLHLIRDKHPPVYYLLLHLWTRLFGDGEVSVRLMTVCFGTIMPPALAMLGKEVLSRRAGLIAGLLAVLNPFLVWYSQEVRMFVPSATMAILATWCMVRGLQSRKWGWWAGGAALMTLAFYSYLYIAFLVPFQGLYTLLWALHTAHREAASLIRRLLPVLITFAVMALLFLPLALQALQVTYHEAQPGRPFQSFFPTAWRLLGWYTFWKAPWPAPWTTVISAGALVFLLAGAIAPARRPLGRPFLWLSIGVPMLVGGLLLGINRAVFAEPRYFLFAVPFLCLAWGAGLTWIIERHRLAGQIALTLWGVTALLALPYNWTAENRREEWRAAVAYVDVHAGPNDAVLLHPGFVHVAFHYYDTRRLPLFYPFEGDITSFEQIDAPLQGLADLYDVIWLVTSHDEQPDPQHFVRRWFESRYPQVTEQFPPGVAVRGYATRYRLPAVPAGATPANFTFAERIRLAGYQIDRTTLPAQDNLYHPPSSWIHVTLYWSAVTPPAEDFRVELKMTDEWGQVWGDRLEWPGDVLRLYPPAQWQTGELVRQDIDVNLNPATPAGSYRLELRLVGVDGRLWSVSEPPGDTSVILSPITITSR
ncbi:MAG: glycosyltransferase family 39 protein [Anaerolineae bacterium]